MDIILVNSLILAGLITLFLGCMVVGSEYLCKSSKIISIIVIFISSFLLIYTGESEQEKFFNNGYCIECNTKMKAVEHRRGATYYECPECHFGTWH